MKPRERDKDLKDSKDIREASNARPGNLGRFRPLSPSQEDDVAAGGFIPPHGGFADLLSFQKARIVFDGTVRFCERFLKKSDRTYDQMVQAARSGKQNILEGSEASGASKETEIKLTSVARASLGELLEDYRDFLRLRHAGEWPKEHRFTKRLRQLNRQPNANYETFRKGILDQQIRRLEQDFLKEGGLRERMTRARLARRAKRSYNPPNP
jgi:four helix bundle suffix protein